MHRPNAHPTFLSRRSIRFGASVLCGLAAAELLAGLVVSNPHWERLDPVAVAPAPPTALSHVFAGAGVIGLTVLARGLARGTRRAAEFAIVLLASAAAIGLLGRARPLLLATEIVACVVIALRLDAFPRGTAVQAPRRAGVLVIAEERPSSEPGPPGRDAERVPPGRREAHVMLRRLAGTRSAKALLAIAAGWLLAGCGGAYAYLHDYVIYRGFAAPVTPAGIPRGTVEEMRFRSQATGTTGPYLVYLPPGYRKRAAAGHRFPVLYLLHGYPGKMAVWVDVADVDVVANELIAAQRMGPMLIVMPSGKQGALGADTEWADTRSGNWMSYVRDVVADVDQHFATIPDRQHRGIGGVSEGAYGATNIALRNLDLFSILEGGGPYFTQTPTGVFAGAGAAQLRAASPAAYLPSVAPAIHRLGLRAWLFQGRSDRTNPQLLRSFVAQLQAAGAHVTSGFYAGGHDWRLFRRKTPEMLIKASRWFAQHP